MIFRIGAVAALTAMALPALASDCPMAKRDYSFTATGKNFNIGMPPSDSFVLGEGAVADIAARGGSTGGSFWIPEKLVVKAAGAATVNSDGRSFVRLSGLKIGDVLKGGDIPVFKGQFTCRK